MTFSFVAQFPQSNQNSYICVLVKYTYVSNFTLTKFILENGNVLLIKSKIPEK